MFNNFQWQIGASSSATSTTTATNAESIIRYRRKTHDENGQANNLTQAQVELWERLFPLGNCLSEHNWIAVGEVLTSARGYCKMWGLNQYFSEDSVEEQLNELVVYSLAEKETDGNS